MENNPSPVKPSDHFSDSGDEENYVVSSPDVSTESDSNSEANEFIIKPCVAPPPADPQSASDSKQNPLPSSYSENEDSDELELKVSEIGAEDGDGPEKQNGVLGKTRSASDPATPAISTGKKRTSGGLVAGAERPKKKYGAEGSGKKPGDLFRRIFSEDDEIAILKGMISYGSDKKSDPFADVTSFHEFVKPGLQSDPKVDQLLLKMRKLKTKYEKNKDKEESGRARNLKAHERNAYELSKLVNWNEGRKGGKSVKSPKPSAKRIVLKKSPVEKVKKSPVEKADAGGNEVAMDGDVPKLSDIVSWNNASMDRIGARLFEGENRVEGEAEWHKLKMKETELHRKMLELMRVKSKLVSRVLKTENSSQ